MADDSSQIGLTDKEKIVLDHLADAWNVFATLGNKHPDDDTEFCAAIHSAQKLLAIRVARRVDKDVWKQY
jgi:hypothetical protein